MNTKLVAKTLGGFYKEDCVNFYSVILCFDFQTKQRSLEDFIDDYLQTALRENNALACIKQLQESLSSYLDNILKLPKINIDVYTVRQKLIDCFGIKHYVDFITNESKGVYAFAIFHYYLKNQAFLDKQYLKYALDSLFKNADTILELTDWYQRFHQEWIQNQ